MPAALDWDPDGRDWPNREASRFVEAGGIRWHVQEMGTGRVLLLVHGTGASTHSWRDLAPLLGENFRVVAPDLPGHAFTEIAAGAGMSLPGMSKLLGDLLKALGSPPEVVVGNSAGAAILARMALDGRIAPRHYISLNGAFLPFDGLLRFMSPVARLMASTSLAARLFSASANDNKSLDRLIAGTGSTLDARGTALYARLVRSPRHVHGALAMMARWDLDTLAAEMARLRMPSLFLAGSNDRTVPPMQAGQVAAGVPGAQVERLAGLGHLAHEEDPNRLAAIIAGFVSLSA